MTFIITYGPIDAEQTIERQTATDALEAVLELRREGAVYLTVTHIEAGDVALDTLRILADREKPDH